MRKRVWATKGGERREAWIVGFSDKTRKHHIKTFEKKADAVRFEELAAAVRSGIVPEPLTAKWFRPVEFTVALPGGTWRKGNGRETLAMALREVCPLREPSTDNVILHIVAELPPRSAIADVDNLLKPILDALTGVAWVDDTQICELSVRRVASHSRRLHIKLWQIPHGIVAPHLNALMQAGLIADW